MDATTVKEFKDKALVFFSRAETVRDTARYRFADWCGVPVSVARQVFPQDDWLALQSEWQLQRIRRAMDESFDKAGLRWEFSVSDILTRLQSVGIGLKLFRRLAWEEWKRRRLEVQDSHDKVMATLRRLVAERAPLSHLTWSNVAKEAGNVAYQPWLGDAIRKARRELLGNETSQPPQVPDGVRALILPDGWVDLDADVWKVGGGTTIRRSALRNDLADIAWPLMREAALADQLSWSTLCWQFYGYKWAGEMLGEVVPDISKATLRQVQGAWLRYREKPLKRNAAKSALVKIFSRLIELSKERTDIDGREMLLSAGWLSAKANCKRGEPRADYLSESEMDATVAACLSGVKAGMEFLESEPDLLSLSTRPYVEGGAAPVVRWTTALMLLLMLFAGLRRQSVLNLKIGDWAELRPGLFALVWRHGKKREERVAVLAASLARLLNEYTRHTQVLRDAIGTDHVFLSGSHYGYWQANWNADSFTADLKRFAKEHGITRDGEFLNLNCQLLRRTFVTRELYEGRSIWALQLQLGHQSISSTKRYGKWDAYEHPSQVGHALDQHARKALTLWHRPVILEELVKDERLALVGVRKERDQGVGLCRHERCVKIEEGSLPPCSMCEHLVTGPEFFYVWDEEKARWEREIERLETSPEFRTQLIHKRQQYALFIANYAYLKGEIR